MPTTRGSIALLQDGTLRAWGWNHDGQLGDGTVTDRATPVPVVGLTDVVGVAMGRTHALALHADGTVWGWGENIYGALGTGTDKDSLVPVQVQELTDVVMVAAGWSGSLALRADGTVWTWGQNFSGQLGNGTIDDPSYTPLQVPGITNAVFIDAGLNANIVLLADGTMLTWGSNSLGQQGDGTTVERLAPFAVPGLADLTDIDAGSGHTLALRADGVVFAWGNNTSGQLGDGTTTARLSPVVVATSFPFADVTAGTTHSLGFATDGTTLAWGANSSGQIGNGYTAVGRWITPTRVSGLWRASARNDQRIHAGQAAVGLRTAVVGTAPRAFGHRGHVGGAPAPGGTTGGPADRRSAGVEPCRDPHPQQRDGLTAELRHPRRGHTEVLGQALHLAAIAEVPHDRPPEAIGEGGDRISHRVAELGLQHRRLGPEGRVSHVDVAAVVARADGHPALQPSGPLEVDDEVGDVLAGKVGRGGHLVEARGPAETSHERVAGGAHPASAGPHGPSGPVATTQLVEHRAPDAPGGEGLEADAA